MYLSREQCKRGQCVSFSVPCFLYNEALVKTSLATLSDQRQALTDKLFKEILENRDSNLRNLLPPQNAFLVTYYFKIHLMLALSYYVVISTLGLQRALSFSFMEIPVVPVGQQMEQSLPLEISRKKKRIPSDVFLFFRFYRNDRNIAEPICLITLELSISVLLHKNALPVAPKPEETCIVPFV